MDEKMTISPRHHPVAVTQAWFLLLHEDDASKGADDASKVYKRIKLPNGTPDIVPVSRVSCLFIEYIIIVIGD